MYANNIFMLTKHINVNIEEKHCRPYQNQTNKNYETYTRHFLNDRRASVGGIYVCKYQPKCLTNRSIIYIKYI